MQAGARRAAAVVLVIVAGLFLAAPTAAAQVKPRAGTTCAQALGTNQGVGVQGTSAYVGAGDPAGISSGPLPATGGSFLVTALAGVALVLGGATFLVAATRRRRLATLLIGLGMMVGAGLVIPATRAGAETRATVDACTGDPAVTADLPTPVVPEAPLPVLLPVVGLVVTGGAFLVRRRRATPESAEPSDPA